MTLRASELRKGNSKTAFLEVIPPTSVLREFETGSVESVGGASANRTSEQKIAYV